MAQWLSHSNQKLYQARLLLENQEQAERQGAPAALLSALQEAVVFQLILAYQSYLNEVAEIAQCREEFYSLQQLIDLVPVATGEMTELRQLEVNDFSWLSQLQVAFQACSQKDSGSFLVKAHSPRMIQLKDQTGQSLALRDWYQSLSDLIDLQRNNRQES